MDSVSLDVQTLPLIHSENVSSLVSDSGITRYRVIAQVWDIFDNPHPDSSYSYFPKGFYVEQFDSVFNVEGSIEGDTAYYYDKKSLWHLISNVKAINLEKEKFETQELFWNEKLQKIYSDQAIRIEKPDGTVILGKGFESNSALTDYHIFKTYGIFYISEKNDSIP
jgi:LPS export ABC transporter protein LptC